ncbi:insulinase family protein [Pseudorhodobacter turbinis]|uniref:Insulinase family protein n=2 Tax=Pseudorhodobacter turbinis TaxID=2500533 RepID=A0A4P8EG38_9RHOB|nr:pitrilysin family protein [Pseudorhodobacter turbinis]QCO56100.1 insulinase family protein [Pseudorhodobacter turbinis]
MMMRFFFAAFLALSLPAHAELPIQKVTSPGGITAWLIEDHEIPFTALEIRMRGGTSLDPVEQRGVVNLMTALLEEGAGDLDAQGFANARDSLAASFSFQAWDDSVSISAQFLTENQEKAIDLLHLALTQPRFDADAVERVRGQVLSNIRSDVKNPDSIASKRFNMLAYGDHAYGRSGGGTEQSVAGLSRADLQAAFEAAITKEHLYVAATGDISAADLGALLDKLLGDLPAKGAPLPERADWALQGGETVVEFPGPQSVIHFGQQGIKRDDPDFFAAYILNEVLGGGRFSARLMTEVRDKRGLTYGISTHLADKDYAEVLAGRFSSANATALEAVEIVRAEWARAANEGITAEELAKTKTYLTGSYPLRFSGNSQIAGILVGMQMDGMPIDYATTRNARIEAVTLEDVAKVAKRLLRPEDLHFVIVGQPETTP